MTKSIIATEHAPAAIGPYVQATRVGNMLYTSGQIPLDPVSMEIVAGGIAEQTKQVMDNLLAVLSAAGGDATHIVKTTCYLKDMNDFVAFNGVYASYFTQGAPSRSCIEAARLPKDVLVEVEVIAYLD